MSNNKIANSIIDKIFAESKGLFLMNVSNMTEIGIAAIYTGLVAFLVAGYRNDNELCLELTPTYQRRIMGRVNKEEYERYTNLLNDSYVLARNKGIELQYMSKDWRNKVNDAFIELMLKQLGIPDNEYTNNYMREALDRLYNTAIFTKDEKSAKHKKPRFGYKTCFLGSVLFCLLFIGSMVMSLPSGRYVTNFVEITNKDSGETWIANLLIKVDYNDDDFMSMNYVVNGIVDLEAGKIIDTASSKYAFGTRCLLVTDSHARYYTTVNYYDVNVTLYQRFIANPALNSIFAILCIGSLIWGLFTLYKSQKA